MLKKLEITDSCMKITNSHRFNIKCIELDPMLNHEIGDSCMKNNDSKLILCCFYDDYMLKKLEIDDSYMKIKDSHKFNIECIELESMLKAMKLVTAA